MSATPTDPAPLKPPQGSEHAALRTLLQSALQLLQRGLRELTSEADVSPPLDADGNPLPSPDPAPPAPAPSPPSPLPSKPLPSEPPPSEPPDDSPDPSTPSDQEPTMPIGTKNFAFAHARIESDGEQVRVSKATGFTPAISHPSDPDPAHCAPADDLPKVVKVRPAEAGELPANTLLYRLTLPANHQIDRTEAVVLATGADRKTHGHYRMSAWAVNDRSVEVGLQLRHPDVNNEAEEVFVVDVLVFRVD